MTLSTVPAARAVTPIVHSAPTAVVDGCRLMLRCRTLIVDVEFRCSGNNGVAPPQQYLREMIVRHFDRPRIDGHLRVTIGTDAEMETFCAKLAGKNAAG